MDETTDNLRLSLYLKINRKKNMNGMNLRNSSVINENINGITSNIDTVDCSTRSAPIIPTFSNKVEMINAYARYPAQRANARATSLSEGF